MAEFVPFSFSPEVEPSLWERVLDRYRRAEPTIRKVLAFPAPFSLTPEEMGQSAMQMATLPQRAVEGASGMSGGREFDPVGMEAAMMMAGGRMPFARPGELGAGGGKISAPAVRPQGALFDYSKLAEVPDRPQFSLERYEPPRGVPERTEALADKANVKRVNAVVKSGAKMGGLEWYNTEPLRQAFVDELGENYGNQAYQQYIDLVAATSPRSNVGVNARNASYYYTLAQQGKPLPTRVRVGNNWTIAEPLPKPYGHVAQGLHVQNAENVLNNGGWPVLQNPKPASFSQNLQGNQFPVTVDTHNARLWGMTDSKGALVDKPANTEYGFIERLQQEQARKLGMSPAQYQASAWVGGGKETGLRSTADPFLKVLEDRIERTAKATGQTKQQVLRRFIRGEQALLGLGATSPLAAAALAGAPTEDSQ